MPAGAWYNENDEGAAAWLEELIAENLIAPGVVDRRSIKDVSPDDLRGFTQCHFFAGIGIWSLAARSAGWPDERPIWTGSCPCQPGSEAGKGLKFNDPRHLWPWFFRLIAQCRPDQIFGEQVAAWGEWIDLVRADLEGLGAAFASPDLPAAGFAEGDHRRQRFYWMADLHDAERWADVAAGHFGDWPAPGRIEGDRQLGASRTIGGLGIPAGVRRRAFGAEPAHFIVGSPGSLRPQQRPTDWLYCQDDRWRPVEAGTLPLAAADPTSVGLLRGYGNALDFETAKAFVTAFLEAEMLL